MPHSLHSSRCHRFLLTLLIFAVLSFSYTALGDSTESDKKPGWAEQLSKADGGGYRYFVGLASDAAIPEEALQQSWLSALDSAARSQFPFLLSMTESSTESLSTKDSKFRRESTLAVERVHWDGIEEAGKYFEYMETDGVKTVSVYRLLRWKVADIDKEKTRLQSLNSKVQDLSISYDSALGKKGVPTGSLVVTSEPPGALVLLNGEFAGKTNASFARVGVGTYQLALQLDGYENHEQQIVVVAGNKERADIKMLKNHGSLAISSNPSGAIIYVNNVPISDRTPATLTKEQGSYDIRVEAPGYFPDSKVVTVSYGSANIEFELKAKPGKLSIITNPSGAVVELDGTSIGKSNIIERMVAGGSHEIKVSKPGFLPQTKTIHTNESAGQTLSLSLEVEPPEAEKERLEEARAKAKADEAADKERSSLRTKATWFAAGGLVSALGAAACEDYASTAYKSYKNAQTASDATKYRDTIETLDGSAEALGTISLSLFAIAAYEYYESTKIDSVASLNVNFRTSSISLSLSRTLP